VIYITRATARYFTDPPRHSARPLRFVSDGWGEPSWCAGCYAGPTYRRRSETDPPAISTQVDEKPAGCTWQRATRLGDAENPECFRKVMGAQSCNRGDFDEPELVCPCLDLQLTGFSIPFPPEPATQPGQAQLARVSA
jgi:hypothetical protein